jgi:asparagine synthase (glutamine-hydrolysing)
VCGIAGKVSVDGSVKPELIERMCELIEHRGPDSRGVFMDEGAGLGIQRLAIIDLETGDQPIFNEDRTVALVLNGEIYNYRELRERLVRRGHRFATSSDTEVIVHLYEDHGDSCVDHLRGMFAFALWDRRARRLLLARDRLGKKPLVYAALGNTLWFGSEAKSLLQDPLIPRDVDLAAIDAFLHYRYVPEPKSAFGALRKLPAAHTLSWRDGRASVRRYWKLSYRSAAPADAEQDVHELIRQQLLEATRLRLRADVPLGAFLSGGVDSSAVVAAMSRAGGGRVRTFSIGFDVAAFDETAHARQVARLYDTEHEEFRVEPDAMGVLPRLVWHYGEPFADESAIATFQLARLAAGHVKVALCGDGGDENFAGYDRYRRHLLMQRARRAPRTVTRAAASALERLPDGRLTVLRRARSLARYLSHPLPERYAMSVGNFVDGARNALYTDDFRRAVGASHPWEVMNAPWHSSDAETLVERLLDVDVQTYLPGDLLAKVDIASMAHSLELRSPLLDHRLMETVAALPAAAKLTGGSSKHAFRDALRPWLPDDILDRPKMGFGVPIAAWFRGALRELPRDVLLDPRSLDRGWFRPAQVRTLIDEHAAGRRDHAGLIWAMLQLELWMRAYIDGGVTAPPELAVG